MIDFDNDSISSDGSKGAQRHNDKSQHADPSAGRVSPTQAIGPNRQEADHEHKEQEHDLFHIPLDAGMCLKVTFKTS